jgi:hypothetical protein
VAPDGRTWAELSTDERKKVRKKLNRKNKKKKAAEYKQASNDVPLKEVKAGGKTTDTGKKKNPYSVEK